MLSGQNRVHATVSCITGNSLAIYDNCLMVNSGVALHFCKNMTDNIMKNMTAMLLMLSLSASGLAQTLGDFTPKDDLYGKKKLESKEIYIANFSVNYQIYNESEKKTASEFNGSKLTGNSKAALAVGLGNISERDLQELTNEAYNNFINDFKAKGFTILHGDAAAKTDFYEGYERVENGEMSLAEAPGVITVYPENTVFFVKGYTGSGMKKQGGFLGSISRIKGNSGIDQRDNEIRRYPKLSNDLNGANIIDVDLYVLFLNDEKAYQGRGAKIRVTTNLRLSANDSFVSTTKNESLTTKLGITSSKKTSYTTCRSRIDIVQGKNGIAVSPLAQYGGNMKKSLDINDVIVEETITSFAQAQTSMGTQNMLGTTFRAEGKSTETAALVSVNPEVYKKGVRLAIDTFLKHHINNFTSSY